MRDLFAELRRRHVYKVAIFYAVGAWVLVQMADIVRDNFAASDRIMQAVILLAALGFPVALMLAWVYDLTPRGIKQTPALDESGGPPAEERPGIVVLAFASSSGEPEDEVLSDGFTEELTTLLASLSGLPVISRGRSDTAGDRAMNVAELGRELGVRYLLEGSLRRVGDQVRVTAQLIQASDGGLLWAHNYDTSVAELSRVQDTLLRDIAGQIESAKISAANQ